MSRINTNVASLTAQRSLAKTQQTQNDTLQRLSTGLRINRGADDPAGLIASESLRSEISGIGQAVDNSQRASNVIATAEGALNEVASLLLNIKDQVVGAANTGAISPEEIAANQLQVDSAVESITRISNTTSFAGLKLLDGQLDYVTSGLPADVRALQINQANFGSNATIPVQVEVITPAAKGGLTFQTSAIASSLTLEVTGNEGVEVLQFTSGTAASAIAFAVNRVSDSTGVTAVPVNSANPASGVTFQSAEYGSKSFVSLKAQGGAFATVDAAGLAKGRAAGVDTVATVNGALTVGDGLHVDLNTHALDLGMKLDPSMVAGDLRDFDIVGGGARFQLGAKVAGSQQVNIGLTSVAASKLGDNDVGYLTELVTGGGSSLVGGNTRDASRIIERAISQVAIVRGRLGAFEKNTLNTNINSLGVALENVTGSESKIRDADFARQTSELTRSQILTQAGTSVLSTANSSPQSVLSLLQK